MRATPDRERVRRPRWRRRSKSKNSTDPESTQTSSTCLALRSSRSGRVTPTALEQKGLTQYGVEFFAGFIQQTGVRRSINKSDGEPAMKARKDAAAKAPEGAESIPQESPVGDRQVNGAIESHSRDGRHVVRVVPSAPKVPHAPKEDRTRTGPSGLRPAEMRRRKYFIEAQPGAAEAEQKTRRWKESTESAGSPLRVGEAQKEKGHVSKEQCSVHSRRLRRMNS